MTRNVAIFAAALVVLGLAGMYAATSFFAPDDEYAQCRATSVAGGAAAIGGPFTLVSETGDTVTEKEVIDKPTLVYFGYTFCPDVCPIDAARNADAVAILEERGLMVKPVFITVDPKRDTPEVVREFTDYMHPRMLGLTGSEEQISVASKAYRAYSKIHEPDEGDEEFYLVDHSTQSYLMFPEKGFMEFFRREDTAEEMAERIQCFMEIG
ncbi:MULTISPECIES: SCO family protein [unclassified Roseovarius]|uniref:SCO family protein n=1 Tax=unclassified Roseovarius TaxID=2614913 RepID=UPI00273D2393|nr:MULTISPECIES: SCO family protein [unclassified Roseovarius]